MEFEQKAFALRDVHYRVLDCLKRFWQVHQYSPSIRELVDMAGLKSTSHLILLLNELEVKGYITRRKTISRSIVIVKLPAEKKPGQQIRAADQETFRVPPGTR